ncbi:MAG: sigma factor-like helix-turn-helix DNA-binding protein [Mycobacterium sp.]|nr:sigma factor-like helix-turn-helix DNA-binding protein [Mycobacterium sp.]
MTVYRCPPVPDEFAEALRQMRAAKDHRLNTVLLLARDTGWTLQTLGDALGLSRERVRQLAECAYDCPTAELPTIPPLPPRPRTLPPPPPPKPTIDEPTAIRLRELQELARTVNGVTPADSPARRASEELAELMADLVGKDITQSDIARACGISASAVRFRIGRHGYGTLPPSLQERGDQVYRNQPRPPAACGTPGGARRHRRQGEPVCQPCKEAMAAAWREYYRTHRDQRLAAMRRRRANRNAERLAAAS